ncbi:hypothetical protein [Sulfobacillus harzensis]|uniref:DUF8173 domain-containing protein n=1 Tax=Sulfobacillus harzensis TaxID=2729629 RepID=A0A7Y0L3E3_9FIRM|nr:hypothetical protein [Sulfobacillus harzensis]NMP22602.1 hypothetical protein [Sulfobacillus harzensis]
MKRLAFLLGLLGLLASLIFGFSEGVYAQNVNQSVGNYTVPAGQVFHGNIHVNVGNVTVAGRVDGNVDVNVGNVVVSGTVTGNVDVGTGHISTPGDGRIEGTRSVGLGSAAGSSLAVSGAGSVLSTVGHLGSRVPGFWSRLAGRLLINVVLSVILIAVFPRPLNRMAVEMEDEPVRAGTTGCLSLIGWVIVMVGLAVIIIGIPLTLLLAFLGAVALVFSNAGVVWFIGRRLQQAFRPDQTGLFYASVVSGGVALTIAETIPGVGSLVELAAAALGIGAVVRLWVWKPRI